MLWLQNIHTCTDRQRTQSWLKRSRELSCGSCRRAAPWWATADRPYAWCWAPKLSFRLYIRHTVRVFIPAIVHNDTEGVNFHLQRLKTGDRAIIRTTRGLRRWKREQVVTQQGDPVNYIQDYLLPGITTKYAKMVGRNVLILGCGIAYKGGWGMGFADTASVCIKWSATFVCAVEISFMGPPCPRHWWRHAELNYGLRMCIRPPEKTSHAKIKSNHSDCRGM